jgi:hypothetical protein
MINISEARILVMRRSFPKLVFANQISFLSAPTPAYRRFWPQCQKAAAGRPATTASVLAHPEGFASGSLVGTTRSLPWRSRKEPRGFGFELVRMRDAE